MFAAQKGSCSLGSSNWNRTLPTNRLLTRIQARWITRLVCLASLLTLSVSLQAQNSPRIGYIYPAGCQQGDTLQVEIGGQHLNGVTNVFLSGQDLKATVIKHTKPPTQKELTALREKLRALQKRRTASLKNKNNRSATPTNQWSAVDEKAFNELRGKLFNPKKQLNPQISETVTVRITASNEAPLGDRELRLGTRTGVSNPLSFHIGALSEIRERESDDRKTAMRVSLPVEINGQILPGDVDRFRFRAGEGDRLIARTQARDLIPYLADAVPGWFQAVLTLYDSQGKEIAVVDDYRFHPDPVLDYSIPADGDYTLEIRDSIYRGREDFVYRIALGTLPLVTDIFPLGGQTGTTTPAVVKGRNLPGNSAITINLEDAEPGVQSASLPSRFATINQIPFAIGTLPEDFDREPNDDADAAQEVSLGVILNGRIDREGDWDLFQFPAQQGDSIVIEVIARRRNSPVDSVIRLLDPHGSEVAYNDDHEDRGAGLITHHADSRLDLVIPATGVYTLQLGDAQHQGGIDHAYRLRISRQKPDYELRVVPATVNVRTGASVPITVYALRQDGFTGDITLALKDAPPGFRLSGAWVPAGHDQMQLTLTAPPRPLTKPIVLHLEGSAMIQGKPVRRLAVPAEDMMQAFIYRHLVSAKDWLVAVTPGRGARSPAELVSADPINIPAGGTAEVRLAGIAKPKNGELLLELANAGEGMSLEEVVQLPRGLRIAFAADSEKMSAGMKGNLIVDAYLQRPSNGNTKQNKRRALVGTLPAIPFVIVD